MKKTSILLSILFGLAYSAHAQSDNATPQLSIGGTFGATTSNQSGSYPLAGSLIIKYEQPVGNKGVRVTFLTGYSYFYSTGTYYKSGGFESSTSGSIISFVPVEIGIKYYITNGLFVEGDGGVSFSLDSYNSSKVAPVVSPWLGYTIPFGNPKFSLDLGLGFETQIASGNNFNQVAGHVAFNIGL